MNKKVNNKLVFVEGLWHTGKSQFINSVQQIKKSTDKVYIADNLRDLGTVRHATYLLYPQVIKDKNHLYDRSPVTMKVLSDPKLGLYKDEFVNSGYWTQFYAEWIKSIGELNYNIVFIYFRPFE